MKLATPSRTGAVRVPPSVALPGLPPRATVTLKLPVVLVTRFPEASSTLTARLNPAPATTLDGGSVSIASWLGTW